MARAKKEGDLYIASNIDVARGTRKEGDREVAVIKTIRAGQMVSDTDLTPAEVKELKRAGVLRYPTPAEQQAMDAADERASAEAAAEKASQDAADLAAEQEIERQRLAAEQAAETEKERAKLAAEQEKERQKAAAAAGKK